MRTFLLAGLSAVLGGLVGGMLIFLAVHDGTGLPTATPVAPERLPGVAEPGSTPPRPAAGGGTEAAASQTALNSELAASTARGDRLAALGRWREAQEAYLTVLLVDSTHEGAMQGLVRAVRVLAGGNRAVLRRQAEEYRRALATGTETEEHYTPAAMELLIQASLRAAGDPVPLPSASSPTVRRPETPARPPAATRPQAATKPAPARPAAGSRPEAAPRPRAAPTSQAAQKPPQAPPPVAQPPSPPRPAPQEPIPPVNPSEPFMTVTIGPIASGERASQIAAELTVAGFSARVQRREEGGYQITLGPYRESEARRAANHVRARFGDVPVALVPAQ